jgi:hypothetical protein
MKKIIVIKIPHYGHPFIDNENAIRMYSDAINHYVKLFITI